MDWFDAAQLVQGTLTLYADMVAGGFKLTGLGAPTAAADAARKSEVDAEETARIADVDAEETARGAADAVIDAKLDNVSHAEPTRALDTVYQNTSGKLRFVTVQIKAVSGERARALIGSADPPTTVIGNVGDDTPDSEAYHAISFIVPVDYYYEVDTPLSTPTLQDWHEWDLL